MINTYRKKVDEKLDHLIPASSDTLYEGSRYSLLSPGKRIRPLLTLLTAEMLEKEGHIRALQPACALEMVHTYSLIHDDLPCMDDDDYRRGRPTLHRVYDEGHAVLVGDYLLTYAFELLTKSPDLSPNQKIALTQTLAEASGGEGMIGGQIMDIEGSEDIEEMHKRKTAALFHAAVQFGGIVANASQEVMEQLKTFGTQFGQLFQMADDILDDDHPLGKQRAYQALDSYFMQTLETLKALPGETTFLQELTECINASCS